MKGSVIMRILRHLTMVIFFIVAVGFSGYATLIQFGNPDLTQTQVALRIWPGLIPVILSGLALAAVEYFAQRRRP